MQINIKIKGDISLTDELKEHIHGKVDQLTKYLKRYNLDELFVEVELSEGEKEKDRKFRADITASVDKLRLHAVGWGEDLYSAIDGARHELSRRIRREKRKAMVLLKKAGRNIKRILRRK